MASLILQHCLAWRSVLLMSKMAGGCRNVQMAGRPHHGGVFVLVCSMAVEIFYYIEDGG